MRAGLSPSQERDPAMSDQFEIPEDLTQLGDEQLSELLDDAVTAFDARSTATVVTPGDLDQLRALATGVNAIRAEQAARREAAAQAAAEIDALAAQVRGGTAEEETPADGD